MKLLTVLAVSILVFTAGIKSFSQTPPPPGGGSVSLFCYDYDGTWNCHIYDLPHPLTWGTGDCEEDGLCDPETDSCIVSGTSEQVGDWGGEYNTLKDANPLGLTPPDGRQIDLDRTHWITCVKLYACASECQGPPGEDMQCSNSTYIPTVGLGGFAYILEDEHCANIIPAQLP